MRIFSLGTLRDYWEQHPDCKEALDVWYRKASKEIWPNPATVRELWPRSSIVGPNRVVFRIKGNSYRLVVEVNYKKGLAYIRFIGTHAEYDRINAEEV